MKKGVLMGVASKSYVCDPKKPATFFILHTLATVVGGVIAGVGTALGK